MTCDEQFEVGSVTLHRINEQQSMNRQCDVRVTRSLSESSFDSSHLKLSNASTARLHFKRHLIDGELKQNQLRGFRLRFRVLHFLNWFVLGCWRVRRRPKRRFNVVVVDQVYHVDD